MMSPKRPILTLLAITLIFSVLTSNSFASGFIHPLDFSGTEPDKSAVISYIQSNVKATYSKIGMGDPSTLRMMENEELKAFKQLTRVTNEVFHNWIINLLWFQLYILYSTTSTEFF